MTRLKHVMTSSHSLYAKAAGIDPKMSHEAVVSFRKAIGNAFILPDWEGDLIPRPPMVGDALEKRLASLANIKPSKGCQCGNLRDEMNTKGVAWVRENLDGYIVDTLLKNIDLIRQDLSEQSLWAKTVIQASGYVPRSVKATALKWLVEQSIKVAESESEVQAKRIEAKKIVRKPSPMSSRRGVSSFASAFRQVGEPRFVSNRQFQTDIQALISKLPPDITAIAGVARSGLSAATMISMHLHIPMFTIRQTMNDIIHTGNGWRLGKNDHIKPDAGKVAVIDDTCMTGNSLRSIDPLLQAEFNDYVTATVYCNPAATVKPDIHAVDLPWPHLLEWNLFNSVLSPNMAVDFDGILCRDCPVDVDWKPVWAR